MRSVSSLGRSLDLALVVAIASGTSGCVGPAPPPPQSAETGEATGQPGTTGSPGSGDAETTGSGCPSGRPGCMSSTADSGSTSLLSDGSTGTTEGDPSSTGKLTDTDGGSTGPMANPFEGSYSGTWEGLCLNINVNGELTIDVDAQGMLTGMLSGADSGDMMGTADPMGAVMATATAMIIGMCSFEGQIGPMGGVDGTWACGNLACEGTWSGSRSP